jgi:hypothetical protein
MRFNIASIPEGITWDACSADGARAAMLVSSQRDSRICTTYVVSLERELRGYLDRVERNASAPGFLGYRRIDENALRNYFLERLQELESLPSFIESIFEEWSPSLRISRVTTSQLHRWEFEASMRDVVEGVLAVGGREEARNLRRLSGAPSFGCSHLRQLIATLTNQVWMFN